MGEEEQPKIFVDTDWKSQAQAEKERLSEAESKATKDAPGTPGELPPADFTALVGTLATQAIMYLGGIADRASGRVVVDLEMSRHFIDLLGVLEEKTRGNLTADEEKELSALLNELRMRFVEFGRMVDEQMLKQAQAPQEGAPPVGPPPDAHPGPLT